MKRKPLVIAAWVGGSLVAAFVLFLVAAFVLYLFGETLFGSSRSTIDSYNADALEDTAVYPGATLVQVRVHERRMADGRLVRFREHLYTTEATADEVRRFYDSHRPSSVRGVRVAMATPGFRWPEGDEGVTSGPDAGAATGQTVFVLIAGQRYVEGKFQRTSSPA